MRLTTVALLLSLSTGCWAWNRPAHEITGVIAYRVLRTRHQEVISSIEQVAAAHPAHALFEQRIETAGHARDERAERLFMELARWADEVRRPGVYHRYDRPSWHYVNIPFTPHPAELAAQPAEGPSENAFTAFRRNVHILEDATASPQEKAVALSWIFHLVGDIHQPLHSTALFDAAYPAGDRGGNLIHVRLNPAAPSISLHAFWDGAVIGSRRAQSVRNKTVTMLAAHPLGSLGQAALHPYRSPDSFELWGRDESHSLAVDVAYGTELAHLEHGSDVLSVPYVHAAHEVGELQLTLAGYRLAEVLIAIFAAPKSH